MGPRRSLPLDASHERLNVAFGHRRSSSHVATQLSYAASASRSRQSRGWTLPLRAETRWLHSYSTDPRQAPYTRRPQPLHCATDKLCN
jgi:hypothetical protein